MDSFQDAQDYLYSFISYEQRSNWSYNDKTLNLDRFRDFLAHLGSPQNKLPIIHVAGSDGKGSVCAMLAAVLSQNGYRTGLYQSPHLQHLSERIQVDGQPIQEADFVRWTRHLKQAVEQFEHPTQGFATFFELVTAMAYLYFSQRQTDYAVIETGRGGRLDATNCSQPVITVITHISMEHSHLLGDTLEKIADEKLGIIRPDAPVIVGPQEESLLPHFKKRLAGHSAPVVYVDESYQVIGQSRAETQRCLEIRDAVSSAPRCRKLSIRLLGHYQVHNCMTALATLDCLMAAQKLSPLSEGELQAGFAAVVWPGRFETLLEGKGPLRVLDVAHTVKGAKALRLSLDEQFPHRRRIFVTGFLREKDPAGMIDALVREQDSLILTQAPTPRGLRIDEIQERFSNEPALRRLPARIQANPEPQDAYHAALELASPDDVIVITGSVYLVGALRETVLQSA